MIRLQQSVISRTCNNEHRMHLRWFVWHLGNFPAIQSLFRNPTSCTEAEDGHFELFLNLHEATGWKQCFRRPMFINYFLSLSLSLSLSFFFFFFFFFIYCSVDSLPTGLATHFSWSLYSNPYKCGKVNAGQTSHLTLSQKNTATFDCTNQISMPVENNTAFEAFALL